MSALHNPKCLVTGTCFFFICIPVPVPYIFFTGAGADFFPRSRLKCYRLRKTFYNQQKTERNFSNSPPPPHNFHKQCKIL